MLWLSVLNNIITVKTSLFAGESVNSDEAAEPLNQFKQDTEMQTTNFTVSKNEGPIKSASTRNLTNFYYPQKTFPRVGTPSVPRPLQNASVAGASRINHYVTPQSQKLLRQTSAPVQRSAAMLQPLPYASSNGTNSNNVTLTREGSRVQSRCSTACGSIITKPMKINAFDATLQTHKQPTSPNSFQSPSAIDPLLNEGVL